MPRPIATFVIPCCNGEGHIEPMLQSLLAQSRQDFDLLLVDDASTDSTVERARAVAGERLQVVAHSDRIGLARNFAFAASRVATPFFCVAHQDDVYEPDYLAALIERLQRNDRHAFAHCLATAIDGESNEVAAAAERFKRRLAREAVDMDAPSLFRLLYRGNFICCPSVLFRTDAYREVGGFDVSLSFALDWDLWLRTARARRTFATVLQPLIRYRRHQGNATREATRSLARFEEEVALLGGARAAGEALGWIEPTEPPSRSLRNNLVNEAFEDLAAGQRDAFDSKMAFVATRLPELRRDPYLMALRALARCGRPGVGALAVGRRLAVMLGLG